jgi:hypothetical protein
LGTNGGRVGKKNEAIELGISGGRIGKELRVFLVDLV